MSSLAEFMILSGGDNRPPMLEKHLYDSWKSRMELYMQNREHGRMILESVEHGLLIWPTIEENGVTKTKKYEELSATRKFKLIVNTKLLNSLPPKWSKFMTDVKRVIDLHTTNFDQLNAYLEQHELHANEVCIMCDRNQDPLALVGRQRSFAAGTSGIRAKISRTRGNNLGQQRVVKCFNYQGEGHMAIQCSKPKRKRDATWFRDKVLLVEAQGSGKVLNEEELAFLADLGVLEAKSVLMANLSSYRSDVLSEVPHSNNTHNDMLNQSVQEMSYSEQTHLVNYPKNEITSDSNIIPYSQYLLETQNAAVKKDNLMANESLSAKLERYKERVKLLEERQNVELSTREKLILDDIIQDKNAQFADFEKEINSLKQTLSEQLKEKESLKQALGFQNPFYLKKAQQIRPMLYDGSVITKETNVISIADSETLMLEEESRSKMLLNKLNRLSKDFGKHFVSQHDLFDEQAFWLQTSHPNTDQSASSHVKIKAPQELPKCNKCLDLEAELIKQHNMVEKDEYNRLSKSFSKLEQHRISLELAMQLNKEIFQKNNTSVNQTEPTFDHLFELNNLKAQLQAKDTTIEKLKANIKHLNKTSTTNSEKKDIDEIETINIELEHRMAKLIANNEHLK
ncbi:hypothetical protein Tco_0939363 [Tanacetum coccineum]|uniref:Uncharacterized protein n=1 Tax=Tanacetum coccineum TaxID=301880 RepID=A0ABQ5DLL5_9ASTR